MKHISHVYTIARLPTGAVAACVIERKFQENVNLDRLFRRVRHSTAHAIGSHTQRIVLATEETTVTQQVSHRSIECQSRSWPQRGTTVNGSHHGDSPLLKPTGIPIATKSLPDPSNRECCCCCCILHSNRSGLNHTQ